PPLVHQAQPDFGVALVLDHAADAVQVELDRRLDNLDFHSRCLVWLCFGTHFSSTSSMTTGVFALIECFRPAGMWTQVPTCASCVSSPRPTLASPVTTNNMAGFAAVCSESSWPRPKPNTTALSRSSWKTVRLRMP